MDSGVRVTPGSNDGNHARAHAIEPTSTGASTAIGTVSDAVHPALDRVALGAHRAVDKLAGAAVLAAESLGTRGEQLMSVQERTMEQCRGYVRAHPLAALGIAATAGYLVSRLLALR